MSRPRLLDLFCGAGGASMGYHRAGFDVTGVDIKRQPRYPFAFVKAYAMTYPLDGFDAVHASPPCNDHSALASIAGVQGTGWMLEATLERLRAWGGVWVVENVERADELSGSLTLCGTEFGLGAEGYILKRHRLFDSSVFLMGAGGCHCRGHRAGGVYGNGGGQTTHRGKKFRIESSRIAMGIDWMSTREICQALPPVYTQHIGEQLLEHVRARA